MELWSKEHMRTLPPAVAGMLILAVVLRILLGKKSWEIRMIPFQIVAVAALLLEIGKQAVSISRGYDLYHLPFHFCSIMIFMLPAMAFYRGKHRQAVTAITSAVCASVFLLVMIYPCLIYSAWDIQNFFSDYMGFHTVVFHNLALLAFILIVALELHTPIPNADGKPILLFILGFCTISATMAQLLRTNYNNFYSCNIPPLQVLKETVCGMIGYVPSQILYICIVTILDVLFVTMAYWFCVLLHRFLQLKAREKEATLA